MKYEVPSVAKRRIDVSWGYWWRRGTWPFKDLLINFFISVPRNLS